MQLRYRVQHCRRACSKKYFPHYLYKAAGVFGLLFSLLLAAPSSAQEMEVPTKLQYALLQKILLFDRHLQERAGAELVIGIVYQSGFRLSLNCKDELSAALAKAANDRIVDLPVRHVAIDLADGVNLGEQAAKHNIDILYVAPLRAVEIKSITAVSRSRRIFTFTGVPAYVEAGLAAGLETKGGKPHIIVNLPAAKAEGVEFHSQLLNLAKVIE